MELFYGQLKLGFEAVTGTQVQIQSNFLVQLLTSQKWPLSIFPTTSSNHLSQDLPLARLK
jgi:hypothetical protein